ncbi:hypothetical protein FACS1894181_06740 [Bacteroidia bacterium]|nr:hypothetical protein FACS1894181_06740 [Bacteroidia bacterium]
MLRRDFIMVQIEELGKVIAQIIGNRNTDAARKNTELIQVVYNSLRINSDYLLRTSAAEVRQHLNGDDNGGLQRMEIAAKLLMEEAFLHPGEQTTLRLKARELLEYIQQNDTTFSLERLQLLNELA